MYSAVQKDGQRLYVLARQGIEVEREKRPVTIFECELLSFDEQQQTGTLRVACSKGTYIRTLCHDIGIALGTYGMMTGLRRTKACGFTLQQAIPLEEARQVMERDGTLGSRVLPIDAVFEDKPALRISQAQAVRFSNGGGLALERLRLSDMRQKEDGTVYRVYGHDGIFWVWAWFRLKKGSFAYCGFFAERIKDETNHGFKTERQTCRGCCAGLL